MATPETRPAELANTWAETGTVADLGDIATGWPAGKPGRGRMNKLFGWLMQGLRYLIAVGAPEYNSGCTYDANACGITNGGHSWKRVGAGTTVGVAPGSDITKWVPWGHTDDEAKAIVDTKLGTLSELLSTGFALTAGATADVTAECNFPNSSFKLLTLRVALPLTSGAGSTLLTLSGDAAFGATALIAVASNASTGGTLKKYIPRAAVTGANTIAILADCGDSGDGATAVDVDVVIVGH